MGSERNEIIDPLSFVNQQVNRLNVRGCVFYDYGATDSDKGGEGIPAFSDDFNRGDTRLFCDRDGTSSLFLPIGE